MTEDERRTHIQAVGDSYIYVLIFGIVFMNAILFSGHWQAGIAIGTLTLAWSWWEHWSVRHGKVVSG